MVVFRCVCVFFDCSGVEFVVEFFMFGGVVDEFVRFCV